MLTRVTPFTRLAVGVTMVASCGCLLTNPLRTERAPCRLPVVDYRARALGEFDQAVFHKPRENQLGGIEADLVPLLIHQVVDPVDESARDGQFGALLVDGSGVVRVDTANPTIYTASSTVTIAGTDYQQVDYVWWYGVDRIDPDAASASSPAAGVRLPERSRGLKPAARGVRITLDSDGFPCVWETLSGDPEVDLLFVSDSLERAAVEAFGSPLPGRRYSIERSATEAPRTVVARVIDDGPIPMGPFVYVSAAGRRVITVTCRCSRSQTNSIVETAYYDLEPLESLAGWGLDIAALGGFVTASPANQPSASPPGAGSPKRVPLERRLRWPIGDVPKDLPCPG